MQFATLPLRAASQPLPRIMGAALLTFVTDGLFAVVLAVPVLTGNAPAPITQRWWVQFLGRIPFVGLPLVWASTRSLER